MFGLREHAGPALIDANDDRILEFSDLVDLAETSVAEMGSTRSLMFLWCENTVATVAFYAGALLRRHAVALFDAAVQPHLRAGVIDTYRPSWVAGPVGTAAEMAELGIAVESVFPVEDAELVNTGFEGPESIHPDLAVMLSTSGTTGSTKFVRLTDANIESNARAIAEYLALTPDERPISSLPLHYTFGLSVLNSHWVAGAPTVLTGHGLLQQPFWDAFRSNECTSLAGVPFSYLMLERLRFREMDLPSMRLMIQAGGALDRRLQEVYAKHLESVGGQFFVMYGQTEATARISYVPSERLRDKLGSAGIAIPGGKLSIDTDDGTTTEPGIVGEVVYEGPNVMMGYAEKSEDLARGDELGGVLSTGDLGRLDDEGFLFLTGRSKRIVKAFGLRISLDEVETRLREHGPAAVVADGDLIRAFCSFGDNDSLEDLRLAMAIEFNVNQAAFAFERVDTIPTTTSGKIDYRRFERWSET